MGTLLLDRALRAADENSDARRLARARTLVVLDALGPSRQERAMRFSYEAELIQATPPVGQAVITFKYATLVNLADVDSSNAGRLWEIGSYQWQSFRAYAATRLRASVSWM